MELLSVLDAASSPEHAELLRERGIYVTRREFESHLQTPARPDLASLVGIESPYLVTAGQQVYVDYRPSVVAKLSTLKQIEQEGSSTCFIWVDTVRSGSDKLITTLPLPGGDGQGIRISSAKSRSLEPRFVTLDRDKLSRAMEALESHLFESPTLDTLDGGVEPAQVRGRFERVKEVFEDDGLETLSELNARLSEVLMQHAGVETNFVMVSEVLAAGHLTEAVNHWVSNWRLAIHAFNDAIDRYKNEGIDPLVRPLAEDHLPLFYSCDEDSERLRLAHEIVEPDHFAVAECSCGKECRFHLGRDGSLSIAEIAATNRWSPDVCLPVFQNDHHSGVVGGKSSSGYGLVLNAVMEALGRRPVPMLVPPELVEGDEIELRFDSLFCDFLLGE